jgi:hypothetical protein
VGADIDASIADPNKLLNEHGKAWVPNVFDQNCSIQKLIGIEPHPKAERQQEPEWFAKLGNPCFAEQATKNIL